MSQREMSRRSDCNTAHLSGSALPARETIRRTGSSNDLKR